MSPGRAVRRFSSISWSCDSSSRAWSRAPLRAISRARSSICCRSRAGKHLGRIDRLLRLAGRASPHFLGHRLQIAVERLAQLLHQALDLLVGRALGERFLELLLQPAQVALGEREIAVLDAQRGVPQQLRHGGDRLLAVVGAQPLLRHAQPEIDDAVIAEQRRTAVQIAENFGDRTRPNAGPWPAPCADR